MTRFRISTQICWSLFMVSLLVACANVAQAQCDGDDLADNDYVVRAVKVSALFGAVPQALQDQLAKHRGERFVSATTAAPGQADFSLPGVSSDNETSASRYVAEVKRYLGGVGRRNDWFGANRFTEVAVRYLSSCVKKIPPAECPNNGKCVDVTIKIISAYVNTGSVSANLLALARSNQTRFYDALPRPLLALNPKLWLDHDRTYGPALVGKLDADLLGKSDAARATQLRFKLDGRKAAREPFYDVAGTIALLKTQSLRSVEKAGFDATFAIHRQPQGAGTLFTNAARFDSHAAIKIKHGPLTKLNYGLGYRFANNRYLNVTGNPLEMLSEHAFTSRAIVDGHAANGFLRGALWFDAASMSKKAGNYRRLAGMFGYAKEVSLPVKRCKLQDNFCSFAEQNPPAIGLEALAGFGRLWGRAPEYARFYGGNATRNFLYDATDTPDLTAFPNGPLLRSFGRNRASANNGRGGTAYWNFNLTVSLPLPKLSRPLIPAIAITDGQVSSCDECKSLKDALKNQVAGGKELFIAANAVQRLTAQQRDDLALDPDDGLTPEEQARLKAAETAFANAQTQVSTEANEIWRKINPMVAYIADHANLYSIKPIVMFDAARTRAAFSPIQTRFAFGGGLQFNVVVAKFEVGYLRTLNRMPGDQRGNFVVRMVFEKFF